MHNLASASCICRAQRIITQQLTAFCALPASVCDINMLQHCGVLKSTAGAGAWSKWRHLTQHVTPSPWSVGLLIRKIGRHLSGVSNCSAQRRVPVTLFQSLSAAWESQLYRLCAARAAASAQHDGRLHAGGQGAMGQS